MHGSSITVCSIDAMWRRSLQVLSTKTLRICSTRSYNNYRRLVIYRNAIHKRFTATQAGLNAEETKKTQLRLWSDGGGDDVVSSPFDDLGAWHEAEGPSFLHNIAVEKVGASTNEGKRSYNEDRFQILELDPDFYYFAVFDGHGGQDAVDFVQNELHHLIQKHNRDNKDLRKVLLKAFEECDLKLKQHLQWLVENRGCDPSIEERSGTTATVVLLKDGTELAVGSVGDSRALLCRNGETICLTDDHHPTRHDELQRIEAHMGTVDLKFAIPRVNGRLAMTRSLGDFDVKPYGVIATPETVSLKLDHQNDAFLELHTDGVSHVMTGNEIGFLVRMCSDPEEAASTLTSCALQYGAEDNVTSIIVPLRAWGKFCARNITKSTNIMRVNTI